MSKKHKNIVIDIIVNYIEYMRIRYLHYEKEKLKIKKRYEKIYGKENVILYEGEIENINCKPNEIIKLKEVVYE